ncbi:MAG: 1,4-dihydroxy-2-naphthoate polyprenyltransferase [Actinobacteria bacterium]|nr:1,4-dihydroxy-2-naphthoate polyprenyltransferase [Actinomycetota bacterium]
MGAGLAARLESFILVRVLLALVVALALQIGVNFSNDYSDGIKGTDEVRVGPIRLVGQKLAEPQQVKYAAFLCYLVAMIAGLGLVLMTSQWWLILVGIACVAAAWFYTGGQRPYGYLGLGEVFVFIFFGLVPVTGTVYVQTLNVSAADLVAACAVGFLICTLLVVNNLRDIPTDTRAGKHTLAVKLGDRATRILYVIFVVLAFALTALLAALTTWWLLLGLLSFVFAIQPVRVVISGATGPMLIIPLKQSGILILIYGLACGAILAWG